MGTVNTLAGRFTGRGEQAFCLKQEYGQAKACPTSEVREFGQRLPRAETLRDRETCKR